MYLRIGTILLLACSVTAGIVSAQNPADAVAELDYYLPAEATYDETVPTPGEIIGMTPGEWHVRHDQLVNYMYRLAEASPRISIREIGRTYENKPLLVLTITSPSNHARLEQIRMNHLALTDPGQAQSPDVSGMPIVVNMGYSIHGDESSGSNAALLVAYHLAAATGPEMEEILDNTVILLDPSFNPDGLNRFASWVNTHRGKAPVADPNSMELDQPWPGGRTNHYWFDLNRDWMPVQHPESQARIRLFHEWKPNILTDHHEMGSNSTFFFQPGIPSRTHPLTPEENQQLTRAIADYHMETLDREKRLYFSEENYDDFYYGKGSTYPDINGSIGILFEQASSRGHARETVHGVLTFPFTIKNQFLTSLSTLRAATNLRTEILAYQQAFYREAMQEASGDPVKAYVFGSEYDRGRTTHFAELLKRHDIEVYQLAGNLEAGEQTFSGEAAFVVPTQQKQYKFIKALFERRTTFEDSLFYDVSAWTMPYAFNLPFAELGSREFHSGLLGEQVEGIPSLPEGRIVGGRAQYAYLFEWDEYYAPRALYRIQKHGIRTKVASEPMTAVTVNGTTRFDYGTVLVPVGPQETDPETIHTLMQQAAKEDGLTIYAVNTGHTPAGIDLGSSAFENLEKPEVAIVAGSGTSSYEVGEAWHLLDYRFDMAPTILPKGRLDNGIGRYNVIVLTGGGYGDLSEGTVNELKQWVRDGGTLIALRYAASWANSQGLADVEYVSRDREESTDEEVETRPYATMSRTRGAQVIGGAIFNTRLDLTNPLGYGFNDENLTVFRNSTLFLEKAENPYATPLYYTEDPLASGYISDENLELLKSSASIIVSGYGRGKVIAMADNPNFRAFWYGTNKLFLNAIFFGQTISGGAAN